MDKLRALSAVSIFQGLTPEALGQIAGLAIEERHAEGDFIFREGDPGNRMYVILEGQVRISRNLAGMGEEALAVLKPSDYFGEMCIVDNAPRSADALTHQNCTLLVLSKESMEDLLFLNKDLAYEILWNFVRTLAGRLRETNDKMTFLAVTGKF